MVFISCDRRNIYEEEPDEGEKSQVSWDWSGLDNESSRPAFLSLVANSVSDKPEYIEKVVSSGDPYSLSDASYDLGPALLMCYWAEGSKLSTQGVTGEIPPAGTNAAAGTDALIFENTPDIAHAAVRLVVSERNGQPAVLQQPGPVYVALSQQVQLTPSEVTEITLEPAMLGKRVIIEGTYLSQSTTVVRSECYLNGLAAAVSLRDGSPLSGEVPVRQWFPLVQSAETLNGVTVCDGETYCLGVAPSATPEQGANELEFLLYFYQNTQPRRFRLDVSKLMHDPRWDRMYLRVKYDVDADMILESSATLYDGNEILIEI